MEKPYGNPLVCKCLKSIKRVSLIRGIFDEWTILLQEEMDYLMKNLSTKHEIPPNKSLVRETLEIHKTIKVIGFCPSPELGGKTLLLKTLPPLAPQGHQEINLKLRNSLKAG